MTRLNTVDIPPPSSLLFQGRISHPDLWLWDSWTYEHQGTLHLFCLALARVDREGRPVKERDRNDHPFHIRHFTSASEGRFWKDLGAYLTPCEAAGGTFSHNVWSGSATPYKEKLLHAFTGIRQPSEDTGFLQSILVVRAKLDGGRPDPAEAILISDPVRDRDAIVAKGYYLPPKELIGSNAGEEGGPILAWRDPYLIEAADGTLRAFWSAKTAPDRPAVAHAILTEREGTIELTELLPPIELPDADRFTQAEVPKVYTEQHSGTHLMLVSTCNRIHEDQPYSEVSKELRLYKSCSLKGPWEAFSDAGAILPGAEHLFGGSFITVDFGRGEATLIAPYTEMAEPALQLTFAAPRVVAIEGRGEPARPREACC